MAKPFDEERWRPAATPDNTTAFTRYIPKVGVVVLYERKEDGHWFMAVYKGRSRAGGHELGKHTTESAKAAALTAVGFREPKHKGLPLEDDFFAFVPGICHSCRREGDILRFKSQCYECLATPMQVA